MPAAAVPFADNLRAAGFMTASMAGFAINDGLIKLVLIDQPLYATIFVRGLFMIALLLVLAVAMGAHRAPLRGRDWHLSLARGGAEIVTTLTYLTALTHMPIANASAILQSAPLAVTLTAALFLAEPVGWRRGLALVVGLVGVLMVVRPGADSFNAYTLFAVSTVAFIVVRDLLTRGLSPAASTVKVTLVGGVCVTATGGIGALAQPWPAFTLAEIGICAIASVFLVLGFICAVRAMRVGEISFAAPFRYTILLFAIVVGVVLYGEWPDALTWAGSALIVGSGLFTFWREQRVAARLRASESPPARI